MQGNEKNAQIAEALAQRYSGEPSDLIDLAIERLRATAVSDAEIEAAADAYSDDCGPRQDYAAGYRACLARLARFAQKGE